jgi:hypothetical protein
MLALPRQACIKRKSFSFSEEGDRTMVRTKCFALAIAVSSIATVTPALAQDFGKTGQIMISADRLFGLTFPSVTIEDGDNGDKATLSRTNASLLFPAPSLVSGNIILNPYDLPRAGIDFNAASGFTVGGSIGFWSGTGKTKDEPVMGPATETDNGSITMFMISPRVGYVIPISPLFAFWPRGGITFFTLGTETTNMGPMPVTTKRRTNGFSADIEAMFVLTPVSHFGITFGPIVDLPLSGSRSVSQEPPDPTPPPDDKVKYTNYGLNVGVLGYF